MMEIKRISGLYAVGFLIYVSIEVVFRFVTGQEAGPNAYINLFLMGNLGGIVLNLIGFIIKIKIINYLPYKIRAIISGLIIASCEFLAGLLINKVLKLNGWDYSGEILGPLFLGQTCLKFVFIWILTSPFVFWVHDSVIDLTNIKEFIADNELSEEELAMIEAMKFSKKYLLENYRKLLFAWGDEIWIL